MSQIIKNYTFNKTAKTITFNDFLLIKLEHIHLITNVTDNVIIYQFNNPAKGGSVSGNVLTLTYDTSAMDDNDKLSIHYTIGEDGPIDIGVNDNVIGKVDQNMLYFEDGFPGTGDVDDNKWTTSVGTGMTITKTGGVVAIATGTTASQTTTIRSKKMFRGAMTARFIAQLSQRIANQNFFLELIDAAGTSYAQWDFSGTVTTTARTGTMASGNGLQVTSTTTATTTSYQVFEILRTESGIQFSTNTANNNSSAVNRSTFTYAIPDLDTPLYLQLRAANGATPPASTTTFSIQRVSAIAAHAMKVAIVKGEGNNSMINSLPVAILNTITATISGTPTTTANQGTANTTPWATKNNAATGTGYTAYKLISGASTNATSVKTSAGTLGFVSVTNLNASPRYLKIYNKASAPTVGTDVPVQTYLIPANGSGSNLSLPASGLQFSTGIALAMTTGAADNDTGAVAAGEIIVNLGYI